MNQLASQALENQATIETLRKERSSFEDLRVSLKASTTEVVKSVENVAALKGELDVIRSVGAQLTSEFGRIRETSREAKDDSAAATEAVQGNREEARAARAVAGAEQEHRGASRLPQRARGARIAEGQGPRIAEACRRTRRR